MPSTRWLTTWLRHRVWLRRDRVTKARAYAQGGIPLYLIIDNLADPPAVVLLSQPGEHGYAQTQAVQAGEPLELPEPFGLSLDTKLLLP